MECWDFQPLLQHSTAPTILTEQYIDIGQFKHDPPQANHKYSLFNRQFSIHGGPPEIECIQFGCHSKV